MRSSRLIKFACLILGSSVAVSGQDRMSHGELIELLGIRQWVVPMPKDKRLEWAFEIRNYSEYQEVTQGRDDWMDRRRKAKVIFMPTGEGDIYRFWLKQANGTSSGTTRIDVCDSPNDTTKKCDASQYAYQWYDKPKRIGDGKTYLIGEVAEDSVGNRRKQIILYLHKYRLNDMLENK